MLKSLAPHIRTSHALLVQWDGFVVNPGAWDPAFLDCDYLGAKWFWHTDGMRVGNGGFSLRSRRLLDALQDPRIVLVEAEDVTIGRAFRPLLEQEYGIRFGSEELADRFAFEAAYPIGAPFGFHGLFNFCRTVPPAEIAAMASGFSDAIARSPQLLQLLRNCAAMGQWGAVRAIARRMLDADTAMQEARTWLARAEASIAQPAAVGRNDPCPCGSGRKYKQCHGALASTGAQGTATTSASAPSVEAQLQTALAAHQRGDIATAEAGYRDTLAREPANATAMHYLGVALFQKRRLDEALPLLSRAAEAVPQEPEFHNNLGLALAAADRNDDAIAAYRRALALKPEHAIAWNNLGLALTAQNRLPEAIAAYRESIARLPQFGEAHWNLALALLAHGEYDEGWREYEWRLTLAQLGKAASQRSGPRWDGTIGPGTTLLVHAEQGLGDAIQFARFAQPLAAAGMRIVLEAPPLLVALLATVPGVAEVRASGAALPPYDAHIPMLSLAGTLAIDGDSIPDETPYLAAAPERRASARGALAALAATRRIGVCWAGSSGHANDARRSLPFATLAPLLVPDGATAWVSLQHGREMGAPLVELDARNSMDGVAALIAELDLVITVDTSIAHLAGALGRPTWLLLPFAPDWRWQLDRSDSPWYPTMRLFRQPRIGDWNAVIRAVADALRDPATDVFLTMARDAASRDAALADARRALQRGDAAAAEALCRRALDRNERDATAWSLLGTALRHRDVAAAENALRRALALDTGSMDARFHLANLLRTSERPREAIAQYRTILASAPPHPSVLNNLGLALVADGELRDAERAFGQVLAFDPDHAQALVNIVHLLCRERRHAEALQHGARYLRRHGDAPPEFWIDLGICHHAALEYDAAIECFERALAREPGDAVALVNLAQVLIDVARYAEAADALRRVHTTSPHDLQAAALLAYCQQHLCDWAGLDDLHALLANEAATNGRGDVSPFVALSMPLAPRAAATACATVGRPDSDGIARCSRDHRGARDAAARGLPLLRFPRARAGVPRDRGLGASRQDARRHVRLCDRATGCVTVAPAYPRCLRNISRPPRRASVGGGAAHPPTTVSMCSSTSTDTRHTPAPRSWPRGLRPCRSSGWATSARWEPRG